VQTNRPLPKQMLKRFFSNGNSLPTDKIIPQASNRLTRWSKRQRNKIEAFKGPRFIQVDTEAQPNPPAAIEFIKADPVRLIQCRAVSCNGDGVLGHPKVFINLVRPSYNANILTADN